MALVAFEKICYKMALSAALNNIRDTSESLYSIQLNKKDENYMAKVKGEVQLKYARNCCAHRGKGKLLV